ncbi:MAG: histidine kinase [Bacteroidetes bacterium]|nr:histidine kinase [Bacteroidota bacterium]
MLLAFSSKVKKLVLLYFSAITFSFLINFCIDILVFGYVFFSEFEYYFSINIPIQIIFTFIYLFVVDYFNNSYWNNKLIIRLFLELFCIVILVTIAIFIFIIFINKCYTFTDFFENVKFAFSNKDAYTSYIESLIVVLFLEIGYQLLKSRDNEIEISQIKYENERYKYNQLKNQVNPHFLFNSLNILSGMVYTREAKESADYIGKLSDVYRYVLTNGEKYQISVREELEFIRKYGEIMKTRFLDGLSIEINFKREHLDRNILPMSLQILVENVVKHNIASESNPLKIEIYSDGDYITVSNNINIRKSSKHSTGIGLKNLSERYKISTKKDIEIIQDINIYKVKIPII